MTKDQVLARASDKWSISFHVAETIQIRNTGQLWDQEVGDWRVIEVLDVKGNVLTSGDIVAYHFLEGVDAADYHANFRMEANADGILTLYSAEFLVEVSYHNEIDIWIGERR
jgi:hypothetical protein